MGNLLGLGLTINNLILALDLLGLFFGLHLVFYGYDVDCGKCGNWKSVCVGGDYERGEGRREKKRGFGRAPDRPNQSWPNLGQLSQVDMGSAEF